MAGLRSWNDDGRDPRLARFASGGELDGARPSGRILGLLECLSLPYGPEDVPFAGATHDEAAGMLAAAAAAESRAAAVKLALVRELIRRHAPAVPGGGLPDPASWDIGLLHEVAAILRVSVQAAGPVAELAWQLAARLPGVGELLDAGVLTSLTVKIIIDEFSVLDGDDLAEAERRLLDLDLGADDMVPGRIRRLCQRIADTIDPDGAARRREQAERDQARVRFFRSHGGAGGLFAAGLPADEALKSEANVQKRALEYKAAGLTEKMDFLRVLALVDLTNGLGVPARAALWQAEQADRERAGSEDPGRRAWEEEQAAEADRVRYGDRPPFPGREPGDLDDRDPGGDPPCPDDPDQDPPPFPDREPGDLDEQGGWDDRPPQDPRDQDADDKDGPSTGGDGGSGPGGGSGQSGSGGDAGSGDDGPGGGPGGGSGPVPAGMPDPGLPTLANMTYPLATVLGQGSRPGEAAGYGSLDPALVRKLANAAAASPRSEFCITFTDEQGHAAAHGCARLIREKGTGKGRKRNGKGGKGAGPPGAGWRFTRDRSRPGPQGGYGSWILSLPGGTRYRVGMHKIPLHDCDHAYATGAYRPGDLLRHLVQVRDGECTFTCCSRPARESDFEHAIPYHKGGATDACNAGMRSRRCHKVKQSKGWKVTQPEPGWHKWTTPSGRSYTKGPKSYSA
jgi:hypothetical protein